MMMRIGVIGFGLTLAMGQVAWAETTAPGFDGLAGLATGHPSEALAIPAVRKAADAVLGRNDLAFLAMMENPGKGGMLGADHYYGSACPDPECQTGYGTLFIDLSAGLVYVTWTEQGALYFLPSNGQPDHGWPQAALDAYEFWPEM